MKSLRILSILIGSALFLAANAQSESPVLQLHTNALYDLAASPNLGLEIQTDLGLAWQLDYVGAWWNNNGRGKFFSNYAFQTELRYYPSHSEESFPYTGHHFGAYGQMATYDFKFGEVGYLSPNLDNSWGIGLSYGYVKRLSKWLSLDITLGLGYFTSKYHKYVRKDDHTGYVRKDTRKAKFTGPTRIEVSLVWNLNYSNRPSYKWN